MTLSSIGDVRQFFMTSHANVALKTDLQTLVQELTSGEKSDLAAHLGPDQSRLSGIDRQLSLLNRYAQTNTDTAQVLSRMQLALDGIDAQRGAASEALLTITSASSSSQIETAGDVAEAGFRTTIQTLNMRFGDRSMFGGTDLSASAMADPAVVMGELRLAVTGLTTAADVSFAVDAWFDTPGGEFETRGYLGDDSAVIRRAISAESTVDIDVRADDQTLRDTLKALAKGFLAAENGVSLDRSDRQTLQHQAGEALLTVASPLADLQARLGHAEGQVEMSAVRIAAQQTSYGIARNELVAADPFETATRLQAVQQQLETQYTLTARLSRLSLTEYLR